MKKIYCFAWTGSCNNELSFCFSKKPAMISCKDGELRKCFKYIRKQIEIDFKQTLKGGNSSYKGFEYEFIVAAHDIDSESVVRRKRFCINPLNLK